MSTTNIVKFAKSNREPLPDPIVASQKLKFRNLIFAPELRERTARWDAGVNWVRILPRVQGSLYGWMMRAECIQPPDGQGERLPSFCHPKSFERGAYSPFDAAYDWFMRNNRGALYHREKNPNGFKLTPRSIGVCWGIHTGRDPGNRLILIDASLYDGAWGGGPGLSYKIWTEANQVDTEPNSPTFEQKIYPDITDEEGGNLVLVEKKRPEKGDRYSSYTVRIGKSAAPISAYWDQLSKEEQDMIVPLEKTFYRPSVQEQEEMLRDYIGANHFRDIFGGKDALGAGHEAPSPSPSPSPEPPKAAEVKETPKPAQEVRPAQEAPAPMAPMAPPVPTAQEAPAQSGRTFKIQEISQLMGSKEGVLTLLENFGSLKPNHKAVLLEVANDFKIDTAQYRA